MDASYQEKENKYQPLINLLNEHGIATRMSVMYEVSSPPKLQCDIEKLNLKSNFAHENVFMQFRYKSRT